MSPELEVVTAAGSRIGLAIVRRFVAERARVVAVDWHACGIAAAATAIGGAIIGMTGNIAEEGEGVRQNARDLLVRTRPVGGIGDHNIPSAQPFLSVGSPVWAVGAQDKGFSGSSVRAQLPGGPAALRLYGR